MALLQTWGANNRVVTNDKVVTYSSSIITGTWVNVNANVTTTYHQVYEYHRYCTKSYMYVGMDRATAQQCAAAMIQLYTRSYKYSDFQTEGADAEFIDKPAGTMCMADISIQQRVACMYDVVINVRENDVKLRTYATSPSYLFSVEDARQYDDGE